LCSISNALSSRPHTSLRGAVKLFLILRLALSCINSVRIALCIVYLCNVCTEQSKVTTAKALVDTTLTRRCTVQGGAAVVSPSITGALAATPSPGARPPSAATLPILTTPGAVTKAGWSNGGDWLLAASMYHHQQRLRDAALYRRDVTALWAAALQQQQQQRLQQHTGHCASSFTNMVAHCRHVLRYVFLLFSNRSRVNGARV